ncbi:type II toxin-antitoxin system RelE/ParE family toxin [Novosphingobium sp.]|uniref:type II toxin-antitoxin system RelE/ParE family toxin n=1 Tax=Novosphingobium sp. TaxID=1874826 RepID=UPI00262EC86C|nr:type II toxin-antitoxin system RelE/ParE family toxin [Novosphingobium sp.]
MRRVVWANSAKDDFLAIVRHIAADDPGAAERVLAAIQQTGNALADFATGHPGRVAGTYEKSVARLPYVIAYALGADETDLTILRVIHTSRNWEADQWPE